MEGEPVCSQSDDPSTYTIPVAPVRQCDQRIYERGEDRRCTQPRGIVSWSDSEGNPHAGCVHHWRGLMKRYPETLPQRAGVPHGVLSLITPWSRAAFGPADRILIEDSIPQGYRINVGRKANHGEYVLYLSREGEQVTRIERRDPIAACYELIRAVAS